MTVDEFERTYEERLDGLWEELIEGEIYVSPLKTAGVSYIQSRIFRGLAPLEEQGFTVLPTVACHLTDDSLPNTDTCAIRNER